MQRTLFDDELDAYRASARSFMDRYAVPRYSQWEADGVVDREYFARCGELGVFAAVPEEYGGAGVRDFRYNVVFQEESVRAGVIAASLGPALQADVVLPYLLDLTTPEQRTRWLPGVGSGERIVAIGMTEPGTGSDLSGIRTRAVREGDHYVVNGAKTFITNGINADLVLAAVRTGDHPHKGLSLLMIEDGMPGFTRGRNLDKVGLHAQDTAELSFVDVRVPVSNLVGAEGGGFAALTSNLPQERISIAAYAIAHARQALTDTIEYAGQRRTFGEPILTRQALRHRLADLVTEAEITQHFVDRCVQELNNGSLSAVDAAKAKLWATEVQGRVLDGCVQIHGGYGYMLEYPVAKAYVDGRVSRIYGGTSEIMREIIGRSLGAKDG